MEKLSRSLIIIAILISDCYLIWSGILKEDVWLFMLAAISFILISLAAIADYPNKNTAVSLGAILAIGVFIMTFSINTEKRLAKIESLVESHLNNPELHHNQLQKIKEDVTEAEEAISKTEYNRLLRK
jgi:hypothetical protein